MELMHPATLEAAARPAAPAPKKARTASSQPAQAAALQEIEPDLAELMAQSEALVSNNAAAAAGYGSSNPLAEDGARESAERAERKRRREQLEAEKTPAKARWEFNPDYNQKLHNTIKCHCVDPESGERTTPASVFISTKEGSAWSGKWCVSCVHGNDGCGFLDLEERAINRPDFSLAVVIQMERSLRKKAQWAKVHAANAQLVAIWKTVDGLLKNANSLVARLDKSLPR
jgi:hypothetical protein